LSAGNWLRGAGKTEVWSAAGINPGNRPADIGIPLLIESRDQTEFDPLPASASGHRPQDRGTPLPTGRREQVDFDFLLESASPPP
jgi:hypothetical protein